MQIFDFCIDFGAMYGSSLNPSRRIKFNYHHEYENSLWTGITIHFFLSGLYRVSGVVLEDGESLNTDVLVLAVGHSSRPLYERLIERGGTTSEGSSLNAKFA